MTRKTSLSAMMKNFHLRALLWQAVVNWFLVTEIVSESYTKSYDGYVFTAPFFNPYKTKYEAQIWCSQNGSKLLDVKSSYVQNLTVRFLNDWPTGVQYPDGTQLITDGIRSDVPWNWINYLGIHLITVYGQGSDLANSFGYINFNPSRLYISASMPTEMRGYICQVAGKVDCTNGFSKNGSCFRSYSSPSLSWFDARNRCLNDGGDMASFDFINDDQQLNSTLYGSWLSSSTTYWIGIRRQWWLWQTSNFEANYTNWMNGRPVYRLESSCLCLSKSGSDWKWIECDCSSTFPIVCITEPPSVPSAPSSTTQVIASALTARTTFVSVFRSITATYSNTSTMEPPPLPAAMAIGSTDGRVLAVGLGIGIPLVTIILALIVVIIMMKKKLSYQARLLANRTGDADTVTHVQSPVKRNPQTGVNGSVEMVSEQNTSPYESLKHEETTINDGNYQELRIPGGSGTNNPQNLDYEPLRIG